MAPGSPKRTPTRRTATDKQRHESNARLFGRVFLGAALLAFWLLSFRAGTPTEEPSSRTVIVLDESGSMQLNRQRVIAALNGFIAAQQAERLDCRVTLIKFSEKVTTVIDDVHLSELRLLTEADYQPNGGTALYDAIGSAFVKFANEKDVLLAVVTDGEENASTQFSQAAIKQLIEQYSSAQHRWNVQYLVDDVRLQQQGEGIGIKNDPAAGQTNEAFDYAHLSATLHERSSVYHKSRKQTAR